MAGTLYVLICCKRRGKIVIVKNKEFLLQVFIITSICYFLLRLMLLKILMNKTTLSVWKYLHLLNKWYIKLLICIFIVLYLLHLAGPPFDIMDLMNTGYVEGVVLDNVTLPGCHWDNKLMGEGNSCDRHGVYEIVQDNGKHASISVYQLDQTLNYGIVGMRHRPCYGAMKGFPDNKIHPGDRVRMLGSKITDWVETDSEGVRGIVDKVTPGAYEFTDYYNCDSPFFFVEKVR